jgi:hypothetical protein
MTDKTPTIEDFKDLARFGTTLSAELMHVFSSRIIEFRDERKDLEDLIPRSTTISILLTMVGMIASTDVLNEETVHQIVSDAFKLAAMKEGENEVKH